MSLVPLLISGTPPKDNACPALPILGGMKVPNHVWDALLASSPSTRPAPALPLLLISMPATSVWPATCPAGGISHPSNASHALPLSSMTKNKTSVCALLLLLTSMPRMPV